MATLSLLYTFTADTEAVASEVNTNFSDIVSFVNNSVVHLDGSKAMTGILTLPASDPVSANQATRKAYVDAQVATKPSTTYVDSQDDAHQAAAEATAGAALDARVPDKVRWGFASGTTNGAGDIAFSHGLGGTPEAIVLQPHASSSSHVWTCVVQNISDTQVNVRVHNTTTGAAMAGQAVGFSWFAAL